MRPNNNNTRGPSICKIPTFTRVHPEFMNVNLSSYHLTFYGDFSMRLLGMGAYRKITEKHKMKTTEHFNGSG